MMEKFDNGSYQIMDTAGSLQKTRTNRWRLKPYFSEVLDNQESATQVNFDIKEPLGVIAQDLSFAQHVPCITRMIIGPITRPCTDTFLCDPSTTSDHLVTSRKDECTRKLQGENGQIAEGLEQEA